MKDYRALPFAAYDLAVYIPGGALFLTLGWHLFGILGLPSLSLNVDIAANETVNAGIELVLFLSASYLIGHLAAFLSTYIIEKPVHNWFGFPSEIWEEREALQPDTAGMINLKPVFEANIRSYTWTVSSFVAAVIHIPVFAQVVFVWFVRPLGFYAPKFPHGHAEKIKDKLNNLDFDGDLNDIERWDKLVEHYVANNHPAQFARMYNYLTIYGVIRLLSLFILVLSWLLLAYVLYSVFLICTTDANFDIRLLGLIIWWQFLSLIYLFSVMGFAKFNRRYFEESLYIFLLCNRGTNQPPTPTPSSI